MLFFTPHGTVWESWKPTGGERDFVLPSILRACERHRRKLNVIANLEVIRKGPGAG